MIHARKGRLQKHAAHAPELYLSLADPCVAFTPLQRYALIGIPVPQARAPHNGQVLTKLAAVLHAPCNFDDAIGICSKR